MKQKKKTEKKNNIKITNSKEKLKYQKRKKRQLQVTLKNQLKTHKRIKREKLKINTFCFAIFTSF